MPQPPPPGSGFSPSSIEFLFLTIALVAVIWPIMLYVGPIFAKYAPLIGGPLSVVQP
jgi:hypothetical protein